ncbi:DUF6456 domain-containing protein [Rhizobium helianthi]|uniref:DUF6456 domain-containing protein n=1 Tax=Rhizobium helianthi TaxID=1132695 RepID=A0ABW4M556_9HYPH
MASDGQKHLRRFLQLLFKAGGHARMEADRGESLVLWLDKTSTRLEASLLDEASRRGFVTCEGLTVRARPEARSFLRRSLAEEEERRFASQHGMELREEREVEGHVQPVLRNALDSPLSQLARLKDRSGQPFLPAEALEAGERLAGDFQRAHLQPAITMRWEPRLSQPVKGGGQGGKVDLTDSALAARERVSQAVDAMGPELAGVALDVCCFAKGLEVVERERGWPARSAKLMLRTALLALARHYAPPARMRRRHHWGDEGYRPDLS